MDSFIQLNSVTKQYPSTIALNEISLDFPQTGMIFIKGKSGCGKTTLLNILGGLDEVSNGSVIFDGKNTSNFDVKKWDDYRNRLIGFVFQDYNLIEGLTVGQNIELVLDIQNEHTDSISKQKHIEETLSFVGLEGFALRKVTELSGGQKQRVAIARAIAKQSRVILADEPTGNLDSESGETVLSLLKTVSEKRLVIIVTHDVLSAHNYGDRIITISNGKITDDTKVENIGGNQLFSVIVSDLNNQKVFEISHEPFEVAKAKLSDWILKNEGKYEYRVDVQKLSPSLSENSNIEKNTYKYSTASQRLSWIKKTSMAMLNLSKKKIRLALTVAMFSLTIFLLLIVSFVLTYDRTESIGRYLVDQNVKEVYLFQENSYENLFFETKSNVVSKGEKYVNELLHLFPSHSLMPRLKIDSLILDNNRGYALASDVTLALTDTPDKLERELVVGRYPQNGYEIAIADYIANAMLRDKDIVGEKVMVDGVSCKVVGIIKTDYEEKQIALKVKRNDLNEFEQFDLQNIYQFAVTGTDFRNSMKKRDKTITLTKSNFFLSDMESRYMSSTLNYAPVSMLNIESPEVLVAGKMPKADNEVLISSNFAIQEQFSEANFGINNKYGYLNIYDDYFRNAYIDSINLADYFSEGISVVGIYDSESIGGGYMPDVLIADSKFKSIFESYNEYYCFQDYSLMTEEKDNIVSLTKTVDKNGFLFNEPAIAKIYQFQEILEFLLLIIVITFSVIMLITIFMLSTYISNNIKVNSKKIGVLKAIGVTTSDVASIFLMEAIIISVISSLLSLFFAVTFIYFVNERFVTQIPNHSFEYLYWNWGMTVLMFLLAIGLSVAAAVFPLLKLSKKKPVEVIRDFIV